jgi:hypothetical protein
MTEVMTKNYRGETISLGETEYKSGFEFFESEQGKQRQTGKTTRLILSLPETGPYYVLSWHKEAARDLERMTKELRGPDVAKNGTFVSAYDEKRPWRGRKVQVYVDWAVFDKMNAKFMESIERDVSK